MNRPSAEARTRGGHSEQRRVTSLVLGRTTTWVLALWSGYMAAWAVASGSDPAIVAAWWLAGVGVIQAIAGRTTRPDEPAPSADPS
jgi:hypothetical protein